MATLATIAGLMTWAFVAIVMAGVANVVAIVALVQNSRTTVEIRRLSEEQARRVEALDERREV